MEAVSEGEENAALIVRSVLHHILSELGDDQHPSPSNLADGDKAQHAAATEHTLPSPDNHKKEEVEEIPSLADTVETSVEVSPKQQQQQQQQHDAVQEPDIDGVKACEQLTRDRYGFLIEEGDEETFRISVADKKNRATQLRLENSRLLKWSRMLANDGVFFHRHPAVVKRRIRKGIPDSVKGVVWKMLTNSDDFAKKHQKGLYQKLLVTKTSSWESQISRDVHRTFPQHIFFREIKGMGQTSLFNVLKVYAIYDEELGYCQGMGFIAGLFLLFMGEEDAFWMLVMLMKGHYNMRGLYSNGLPLVSLRCYQLKRLLESRHPKLVAHLDNENVSLTALTMQWFITNFAYNLRFPVLLRIWDIFLLEQNPKIIFRVGIYLFDALKPKIMKSGFEKIMTIMKDFYAGLDPEVVIRNALKVRLTREQLKRLETEYDKQHKA